MSDIKALRLPESDTYHITRSDTPICKMGNGDKFNTENAQIASIEDAEKFFDRCKTCEKTFHDETGLTTSEIRTEIREAVGLDMDKQTVFDTEELIKLHEVLVRNQRSVGTGSDRDHGGSSR